MASRLASTAGWSARGRRRAVTEILRHFVSSVSSDEVSARVGALVLLEGEVVLAEDLLAGEAGEG